MQIRGSRCTKFH